MEQQQQILRIESNAGGERIETEVKARVTFTEGKARWMYAQVLTEGEMPVAETLEVSLDRAGCVAEARMKRVGGFTLCFAEGREWKSEMDTPAGRLGVRILTRSLAGSVKDGCVELALVYRLFLGEEDCGETKVRYISRPLSQKDRNGRAAGKKSDRS